MTRAGVARQALDLVLALEGGCSDHANDPGGLTCYGITQGVYDSWRHEHGLEPQPVNKITHEEVEQIYLERYWEPSGAADWDSRGHPGIALYLFDTSVQHGHAGLGEIVTPQIYELLRDHPLLGLGYMHAERMAFYTSLRAWPTFGRGWMRRVARVYREAVRLEHPDGQLRVERLNLNGVEWGVDIARVVRQTLWVRGPRISKEAAPPCGWWARLLGRCGR